ncbi:spermatogenesis-associated protein 1 isoform X1 [Talpa occidentalis]|uniref:spermatogenesis-associated protein 1 isoform X1 n=1 Tax=Talpa occidentalis TaxID=50954 RepID=UPI00188E2BE1|nr:spermatogenesis-associated protein 1 isoform X1 [Talpa occidentalis]
MKKDKQVHKIPADNCPDQTLVNMYLNPSRPSSTELVELHVFYVPEGSWNYQLNTVSIEVVNDFISAGFIRVSPHLTLQDLRTRLGEFLGEDALAEKFLFLKCIGNNLAVVKTKQESELRLKSFVPPYALQPELYLLPIMDHLGNIFSSAAADSLNGPQINNGVAEANGKIHIPVSVTLSKEEPGTDPSFLENALKEILNKNQEEASAGGKTTPKNQTTKNQEGNSELPGSSGDSNNNHFSKKSYYLWKNEDDRVNVIRREENQMVKKEYIPLPSLDFSSLPHQPGINDISLLQIEREKMTEQMKQVKKERRCLERIREELLNKIEKLFQQSKLKRCHGFGGWKKKYLETKKITASLDESLKKLQEDLELYYKKLLMQLEAREIRMRPKNLANITDSKNYLIIQITELQHVIDQLKRKLDTDKMKLIIEAKMRKQAVTDVRTLKSSLAQKKIDIPVQPQLVPGIVPS